MKNKDDIYTFDRVVNLFPKEESKKEKPLKTSEKPSDDKLLKKGKRTRQNQS